MDGSKVGGVDQTAPDADSDATLAAWATAAGDTQISAAWATQQFDALKGTNGVVHGSASAPG